MGRYDIGDPYYDFLPNAIKKHSQEVQDDPEWWYQQKANAPYPINQLYQHQIDKALYKEAKSRDYDRYKNTGQTWKNSRYPFTAYSQSYSGSSPYGSGDTFEVTKAIMNLYKKW